MVDYRDRIKVSATAALKYDSRKAGKHLAETKLVERALEGIQGVSTVLDAPCGTGRFTILMAQRGYVTTGVDLGDAALVQAEKNCKSAGVTDVVLDKADLEQLPYAASSFDMVFCFRLFHHLPDEVIRARVVGELCRVARKYVLISYFDPLAFTSIKRRFQRRFFGKQSKQNATSLQEVEGYFRKHDFELTKNLARMPILHTIKLAIFRNSEGTG